MPTAAKLFAAFAFLLVGFFTAEVMVPYFPEGANLGYFTAICAAIGAFAGWRVLGRNPPFSQFSAMGAGLKTSFVLAVWCILTFGIYEMISNALDRRYRTVMDAIEGLFVVMLDFATFLVQSPTPMFVLIIGGVLGGMFASWAAVRWP